MFEKYHCVERQTNLLYFYHQLKLLNGLKFFFYPLKVYSVGKKKMNRGKRIRGKDIYHSSILFRFVCACCLWRQFLLETENSENTNDAHWGEWKLVRLFFPLDTASSSSLTFLRNIITLLSFFFKLNVRRMEGKNSLTN